MEQKPEIEINPTEIPREVLIESLLNKDKVLLFKDKMGEVHIIARKKVGRLKDIDPKDIIYLEL